MRPEPACSVRVAGAWAYLDRLNVRPGDEIGVHLSTEGPSVSSLVRLPTLPDVPPFGEAAGAPDFEAVSWHILFAPAATPNEIVERLHADMRRIMSAPDMKKRAADIGLLPLDSPPIDGIRAYVKSEQEKWGSLVKKLGLDGTQ